MPRVPGYPGTRVVRVSRAQKPSKVNEQRESKLLKSSRGKRKLRFIEGTVTWFNKVTWTLLCLVDCGYRWVPGYPPGYPGILLRSFPDLAPLFHA
eukprot:2280924-Rhodomonas_salina.1